MLLASLAAMALAATFRRGIWGLATCQGAAAEIATVRDGATEAAGRAAAAEAGGRTAADAAGCALARRDGAATLKAARFTASCSVLVNWAAMAEASWLAIAASLFPLGSWVVRRPPPAKGPRRAVGTAYAKVGGWARSPVRMHPDRRPPSGRGGGR
jgi:hypothetical protein